jgi:5-formyltetrahydrofolate cyclo-ligase
MDKASLRARMREHGPVPPGVSARIVDGLFAWLSPRLPGTISAFLPMEGEVDLRPLFDRLPGWRWVLPRVEDDRSVTFRDLAVPRETHLFGMEQPADAGPVIPIQEIDVFLVPGLAFDLRGGRLGNGAGHYDRILSSARGDALSVGIAPGTRLVDVVPVERHDVLVGWLATEDGVISRAPNG